MASAAPSYTSHLLGWWTRHRALALRVGVPVLALIAAVWLGYEFWRLLDGPNGGVDLRLRRREVRAWFHHRPVYGGNSDAVYPPASYLAMAPFFGWESKAFARTLWAVISALMLVVLTRQVVRASGVESRPERVFVALVPLAIYPVGATVGNGQVGIVVVAALIASLTLLGDSKRSLGRDLAIAALMLAALVKPSVSAFFFWPLLFARGGLRPAALTVAGYGISTWIASLWRMAGPVELMRKWARRGAVGSRWGARRGEGAIGPASISEQPLAPPPAPSPAARELAATPETGPGEPTLVAVEETQLVEPAVDVLQIKSVNLHSVLAYFRMAEWSMIASCVLLGLFGFWVWRRRRGSMWTLMGVTAIVVLFSGYHAWYDHILVLLPLVALMRVAREGKSPWAGGLFTALLVFSLAPGGLYVLSYPWNNVYVLSQATLWLIALVFLGVRAAQEHAVA